MRVPPVAAVFSTRSPPMIRASDRAIDRPMPAPLLRESVTREKGVNSVGMSCGAIPGPVSCRLIENASRSACKGLLLTCKVIPPCSVNLIALLTRFDSTCFTFRRSSCTGVSACASKLASRVRPLFKA